MYIAANPVVEYRKTLNEATVTERQRCPLQPRSVLVIPGPLLNDAHTIKMLGISETRIYLII